MGGGGGVAVGAVLGDGTWKGTRTQTYKRLNNSYNCRTTRDIKEIHKHTHIHARTQTHTHTKANRERETHTKATLPLAFVIVLLLLELLLLLLE